MKFPLSRGKIEDNSLEKTLQQRADELIDALSHGRPVLPDQIEELKCLSLIYKLKNRKPVRPSTRHWPIVAACSFLLLSLWFLFAHRSRTQVEVDATVIGAEFVVPASEALLSNLNVKRIGIPEVLRITVPGNDASHDQEFGSNGNTISASVSEVTGQPGSITITSLMVSPGSTVRVEAKTPGPTVKLEIVSPVPPTVQVALYGTIEAVVVGTPTPFRVLRKFEQPRPFLIHPAPAKSLPQGTSVLSRLVLELTSGPSGFALNAPLGIRDLSFNTVDRSFSSETVLAKRVPTLRSGVLYYHELDDKTMKLRAFDSLRFSAFEGLVRKCVLSPGTNSSENVLAVDVDGIVSGMGTIKADDRMPTWLQWLAARNTLILAAALLLQVIALINGLRSWLKA